MVGPADAGHGLREYGLGRRREDRRLEEAAVPPGDMSLDVGLCAGSGTGGLFWPTWISRSLEWPAGGRVWPLRRLAPAPAAGPGVPTEPGPACRSRWLPWPAGSGVALRELAGLLARRTGRGMCPGRGCPACFTFLRARPVWAGLLRCGRAVRCGAQGEIWMCRRFVAPVAASSGGGQADAGWARGPDRGSTCRSGARTRGRCRR